MAHTIIVAGDTGTGKSTAVRNLKADETYVINVLHKPLPFKGSKALYNETKKNLAETSDHEAVVSILQAINSKRPEIKNVIIDDAGFIMTTEFFDKSSEKGYEKFTEIGKHMQEILVTCKELRADLNVALLFHTDNVVSDGVVIEKTLKTIGRLLDDKYNPLATVSVALFTDVNVEKDGTVKYEFLTNRTIVRGVTYPAKSPMGMFEKRIPNDLDFVFKKVQEYYH